MRNSICAQSLASTPPAPDVTWNDRAAGVELAREHALELEPRRARAARPRRLGCFFAPTLVVGLLGELEQHFGVGDRARLRVPRGDDCSS